MPAYFSKKEVTQAVEKITGDIKTNAPITRGIEKLTAHELESLKRAAIITAVLTGDPSRAIDLAFQAGFHIALEMTDNTALVEPVKAKDTIMEDLNARVPDPFSTFPASGVGKA